MKTLAAWIRRRETPLADRLYRTAKTVRTVDMPLVPAIHKPLLLAHRTLGALIQGASRVFYYTPLFRAQLKGTHRHLHLAGSGMPLVTGPLEIRMGDGCRLSTAITMSGRAAGERTPVLQIGDNVGIGWQTTIAVGRCVTLEDNVRIAGRAFLAGYPGHPVDAADRAAGKPDTEDQVGDILLRRDVWLGTGCTVSAGVEIGSGTIVAAGSVVTKSLPAGVLAGGVPARVLRPLTANDFQQEGAIVRLRP